MRVTSIYQDGFLLHFLRRLKRFMRGNSNVFQNVCLRTCMCYNEIDYARLIVVTLFKMDYCYVSQQIMATKI